MVTYLLLLLSISAARAQTDPPSLALALVNVARNDAGIAPQPIGGKLANGPFLIDSLT